jgi:hypothetical protein
MENILARFADLACFAAALIFLAFMICGVL